MAKRKKPKKQGVYYWCGFYQGEKITYRKRYGYILGNISDKVPDGQVPVMIAIKSGASYSYKKEFIPADDLDRGWK